MSIPALQENGFLPPGLYLADLDEIWERFGCTSDWRRMLFNRLQMFVDAARHVEALRMFVAGSYVTAKTDPRDVDVVIWVGERFLELLELRDKQALDLELMFLTREPEGENGEWRGEGGGGKVVHSPFSILQSPFEVRLRWYKTLTSL